MVVAMGSAAQVWSVASYAVVETSRVPASGASTAPVAAAPGVLLRVGAPGHRSGDARAGVGAVRAALAGSRGGSSVLERPQLDQSGPDTTPQTEEGGESGKDRERIRTGGGDRYRVLLLDADHQTESYVEKTLPKAVPGVTPDQARKCCLEARLIGKSVVMVAVKEHAEMHSFSMARFQLRATIEPDNTTV